MIFGEKESTQGLKDALASMETQLIALYEEKTNGSGTENNQGLIEMISSLEEQLKSLYAEKENPLSGVDHYAQESIKSLEEQVICLTNEKMDLESKITEFEKELESMHTRTRNIGAAVFEAAVFSGNNDLISKNK
jgi:chromosome segregation ATPase